MFLGIAKSVFCFNCLKIRFHVDRLPNYPTQIIYRLRHFFKVLLGLKIKNRLLRSRFIRLIDIACLGTKDNLELVILLFRDPPEPQQ